MSWLGFNTAVSGLMGSQRKIHVANHNIASSEREGYSRQASFERANTALRIPGAGYLGNGNQVYDTRRIRDTYIDFKFRKENSPAAEWAVKRNTLLELEGILKGTKEHGINVSLDEFFSSLEDLSLNPSDNSYKMAFRQKADALAVRINETAVSFNRKQAGLNTEVAAKIKEVNDFAEQISNINGQIFRLEIDGKQANDLRDQRDLLVDKLSKLVDIDTIESGNEFIVKVGGTTMIDHIYSKKFEYPPETFESPIDPTQQLYKLNWKGGEEVNLFSGELKGLLESRDGDGKEIPLKGVPYYVDRLDEFAKNFAEKINEVFNKGVNSNGDKEIELFSFKAGDEIRAYNISLSDKVKESLDNIVTNDSGMAEDNKIVRELIALRQDKEFFNSEGTNSTAYSGTAEDFLSSIISTLGTESQYAGRMEKNQSAIMDSLKNQRMSASGVDLNEEMNGVVKYQQLYNASAKMVTVFDQIFETTINRLGLVGR